MRSIYQQAVREQLTQRLRDISLERVGDCPRAGWIRSIREALGMTGVQLARRLRISSPSVAGIEHREIAGTITLASLRKAADALQCDVVYALVPRKPLDVLVAERARYVARANLDRVAHSMVLEQQGNSEEFRERQIEYEASRLMYESSRALWNEHS